MFTVYVLKSSATDKYYIGQTADIGKRLLYHNSGYSKSTKACLPWKLVYPESFITRALAMKRETEIRKYKSRFMIEKLLGKYLD
ncbi:MAG: GIY-YIG nuclease family protein [Ignavibacteriota bacterium]|nr:MAG: GIY-YIG nuclease family protein [Chlorobiota bacterium]MBE7477759.1 GIY-YIG nuclease family protein [Ignavibacteriales bacterium]MBL1123868.1 GIY-YIG nuclease family protein [Ignavibacteriota bacterium]MCC7095108.1 GIY-YIG nuclease family protein [Ignavibacteriaceae bacterium]MCE7855074.1 GIY-YIG nuclease family protein [Ignavibacteria bacterium CHB3]MEB2295759.1 GIY-YIG nuclease family protein [Ignavibacteria bacterium]